MGKYTIGLDFGTNSCRSLIVDITNGRELSNHVFAYPSGDNGVIVDPADTNLARQNPNDYILGIESTIINSLKKAALADTDFSPEKIIGIGVDTTGSSPMPVNSEGIPLCFLEQFRNNPAAMVWLWKDHTSYKEAEQITALAEKNYPQYLSKIGGVYSSEWYWSKVLKCSKDSSEVFNEAYTFLEICDWIPAVLAGETNADKIKRSICAAGHKAMYNEDYGGFPEYNFFKKLSHGTAELRKRLPDKAYPSDEKAGYISKEWAEKLGLPETVSIAVGAFDAHMGAVGAGVSLGTLVKILGTSTCDIMISPNNKSIPDIPGVCGIVNESVMKGYYGIEAGQSAVGDIFLWFISNYVPEKYGTTIDEKFKTLESKASGLKPGETGLMALDWNNGNRTVLVDVRLTGLLLGQTLHTKPHEVYRALIEATAFGALKIIDRIEENGIKINDVVNCGGLAIKSPLIMQIYADIIDRQMNISRSEQTPALGAAIFGAISSGKEISGFDNAEQAQSVMTGISKSYYPIKENHNIYKELYEQYKKLHDGFGTEKWNGSMYNVMKDLLDIKDRVRKGM